MNIQLKLPVRLTLYRVLIIVVTATIVVAAILFTIAMVLMCLRQNDSRFGFFLWVPVLIVYAAYEFIKNTWA